MKPSPQQEAILKIARETEDHICIIARAGCAKTTTARLMLTELRGSVAYCAFNKSIATEAEETFPKLPNLEIGTMHRFGNRAWKRVFPKCKMDKSKTYGLLDTMTEKGDLSPAAKFNTTFLNKLVSLMKQHGVLPDGPDEPIINLIDHFDLESMIQVGDNEEGNGETLARLLDDVNSLLRTSRARAHISIDFDDMIYMAVTSNEAQPQQFDNIIIDEAQDLNKMRMLLVLKMMHKSTRVIFIGDDKQAIYGFTGADSMAMITMSSFLVARADSKAIVSLPLNNTFRCPQAVVSAANVYVPDLIAAPQNPEGSVSEMPLLNAGTEEITCKNCEGAGEVMKLNGGPGGEYVDCLDCKGHGYIDTGEPLPSFWSLLPTVGGGDAVLCRKNAPNVKLALQLLRENKGCFIEGRDIAKGLESIVKKVAGKHAVALAAEDFLQMLDAWFRKQKEKLLSMNRKFKLELLSDQTEAIQYICEGLIETSNRPDVANLLHRIGSLFLDSEGKRRHDLLCLSSIHKAKGREWDRVFILGANAYMPSRFAKLDWELEQENNLFYVAITRAKRELVWITVEEN